MPLLIGISGLCGSGKSTAVAFLSTKCGGAVVYLGGMVLKKLEEEKLERTPENELKIQRAVREQHGSAALAVLAAPVVAQHFAEGRTVIIDAIFGPEEYNYFLKSCPEAEGVTLAIHSSLHVRCDRLARRPNRPLFPHDVIARDRNEVLNLGSSRAITLAAHHIVNNSSMETFHQDLDAFLDAVKKSPSRSA